LRWLGSATPDLDEVKASLQRIVSVGDHASQIIGTVRATFKKGSEEKVPIDVNELVREVLTLLQRGCTVIGSLFGLSLRSGFRER
jgi:C4-dicarboxylate-specific signal transduction histidine kinase